MKHIALALILIVTSTISFAQDNSYTYKCFVGPSNELNIDNLIIVTFQPDHNPEQADSRDNVSVYSQEITEINGTAYTASLIYIGKSEVPTQMEIRWNNKKIGAAIENDKGFLFHDEGNNLVVCSIGV